MSSSSSLTRSSNSFVEIDSAFHCIIRRAPLQVVFILADTSSTCSSTDSGLAISSAFSFLCTHLWQVHMFATGSSLIRSFIAIVSLEQVPW